MAWETAASNALIGPAHSLTVWACSVTCVSTKAESTPMPTYLTHLPHSLTIPTVLPLAQLPVPAAQPSPDSTLPDLSCPPCHRTCTSRIGLVGHLRIHRKEAGEPVPEAPTYRRHARPHCFGTVTHRMSRSGHMHLHDNLL
ncbi:unnamed protein product [Schistocephalus solidus]|uniref:C2H2-type domain-containing protein n=1 Tax=Schistocephalus solidus TaxID=70667 RepID=A0A183TK40_SCHSO|nr:unnamed protein product [Schistocephalus solidus]